MNDPLHHLLVEYWLDDSGRDITYEARIVVLPEDYDFRVFKQIIAVKEFSNNTHADEVHIVKVMDQDRRMTTREFSLVLHNGIQNAHDDEADQGDYVFPEVEDVDAPDGFNQPPVGDIDKCMYHMADGTSFLVTIERQPSKWKY